MLVTLYKINEKNAPNVNNNSAPILGGPQKKEKEKPPTTNLQSVKYQINFTIIRF